VFFATNKQGFVAGKENSRSRRAIVVGKVSGCIADIGVLIFRRVECVMVCSCDSLELNISLRSIDHASIVIWWNFGSTALWGFWDGRVREYAVLKASTIM